MLGKSPSAFLMTPEGRPFPSGSMDGDGTSEKAQERDNQHIRTYTTCMSQLALSHRFLMSMSACTQRSNCCEHFYCEGNSQTPIFIHTSPSSKLLVTVTPMLLSHSLSHVETKNMNVCVYLKIVVTQWMWGTSFNLSNLWWLVRTWSLEVMAAFKICS